MHPKDEPKWKNFQEFALDRLVTGYFGIPGGAEATTTKTHVVFKETRAPICGTTLSEAQEFQWCSAGVYDEGVECRRCLMALVGFRKGWS